MTGCTRRCRATRSAAPASPAASRPSAKRSSGAAGRSTCSASTRLRSTCSRRGSNTQSPAACATRSANGRRRRPRSPALDGTSSRKRARAVSTAHRFAEYQQRYVELLARPPRSGSSRRGVRSEIADPPDSRSPPSSRPRSASGPPAAVSDTTIGHGAARSSTSTPTRLGHLARDRGRGRPLGTPLEKSGTSSAGCSAPIGRGSAVALPRTRCSDHLPAATRLWSAPCDLVGGAPAGRGIPAGGPRRRRRRGRPAPSRSRRDPHAEGAAIVSSDGSRNRDAPARSKTATATSAACPPTAPARRPVSAAAGAAPTRSAPRASPPSCRARLSVGRHGLRRPTRRLGSRRHASSTSGAASPPCRPRRFPTRGRS